ncbi:PadR family transcriptional regulator [Pseudofrankia sp. BMG5.37]|nr:PadR family transcriptional regulator [Pseudofrankia sp. BMG5.37]
MEEKEAPDVMGPPSTVAGTASLTPVSYLVLGLVARHGSATPYDLKSFAAQSVGNFWSFPHAQLYKEPPRLAEAGLLAEEREEFGRRRRIFRITDAGRAALAEWLAGGETALGELRAPGLLKLAFAELGRPADAAALARRQAAAHRTRLATYEAFAALPADAMPWSLRRALELGLGYERLQVDFWETLVRDLAAGRIPPSPSTGPAPPAA